MPASEFPVSVTRFWRITTTLPYNSGLPEDVAQNTWHFVTVGDTDFTLALPWLGTFYDTLATNLSGAFSRTADAVTHKVYDLEQAPPNPPVWTATDTLPAKGASNGNMPSEVAIVGSFQAPVLPGVVQARRRGRVYIGPLALDLSLSDYSVPPAAFVTTVAGAFGALLASSDASSLCKWAVFSPTIAGGFYDPGGSGPPNVVGAVAPVDNGWVDNEWDTQRRRGLGATSRTTF